MLQLLHNCVHSWNWYHCRNEGFDKDYVEFLTRMDSLTDKLQNRLETTYDGVWDTPHAFQVRFSHSQSPHFIYSTFVVYMSYSLFDKQYLPRFEKLSEVMPVGILAEKYLRMINTFSQEMDRITRQDPTFYCYYSWRSYHSYMPPYYFRFFKKQVVKPPIPRNYPDSSGKIAWARSLLQHLKYFMEHFQKQKTLRHRPEYQHLVKQYNETGKKLD